MAFNNINLNSLKSRKVYAMIDSILYKIKINLNVNLKVVLPKPFALKKIY